MPPAKGSTQKRAELSERQLKSFDTMYQDRQYSLAAIADRFGISATHVPTLAKKRGLKMRVGKVYGQS